MLTYHRTFRWRIFVLLAGLAMTFAAGARAQEEAQVPEDVPAQAANTPVDSSGREVSEEEISLLIEELGSGQFATRELAATRLTEIGGAILARLSEVSTTNDDPEVRIRAAEIVKQLTRDDLRVRIEAFLAGDDVPFEGWRITQAILGDSSRVRELFVEMLKTYPDLTASMNRTTRDRAMALQQVVSHVEQKMFVKREHPTATDAIALLLPAIDVNVPLEGNYEDILISVLQKREVTKLHRDEQLGGPFNLLLGRWLPRCTLTNREEVLFYGMSWDVRQTHSLALQTLLEAQQTETLVLAFQAIAHFGDKNDMYSVAKFLDDKRPAAERGFANGKRIRTQLGDVAMATIARLNDVPLTEIGFFKESAHPKFGFLIDDIGFPIGDETKRNAARKKIDLLLEPPLPREGL